MKQSFNINDQGPSHSGQHLKHQKPQKLVHFKDPNFHRETSLASIANIHRETSQSNIPTQIFSNSNHNKRRTDCTVYTHDFLSKWNIKTHLYAPVLSRSGSQFGKNQSSLFQPQIMRDSIITIKTETKSAKFGSSPYVMSSKSSNHSSRKNSYMAATKSSAIRNR